MSRACGCDRGRAWAPAARRWPSGWPRPASTWSGIDGELVGGECPYWGCVPSKMMIRAADLLAEARRVAGHGRRRRTVAARLGPGGPAHPRRGHRRLGRHGGGRALRGQGRPLRAGLGPPRRARPGGGGGPALRGRPGRGAQRRGQGVDPAGRRAGRTPFWTNREAIETEEVPARWPCSAAGPSASSSPRCSAGSAPRSPCSRPARAWWAPRSPRPARCWPRSSAPRASTSAPASRSTRCTTTATGSPSPSTAGEPVVADGCWWPPDGGPTWPSSDVASVGARRRRPGRSRSTTTCGWRGRRGCGRSATSPARGVHPRVDVPGRHRGRRHPRPARWSRPTTGPCPGSPSPTPRSARSVSPSGTPGTGPAGPGGHDRGARVDPGVDPQGRQRGLHQAGRGRRPGRAGRAPPRPGRGAARCSAC